MKRLLIAAAVLAVPSSVSLAADADFAMARLFCANANRATEGTPFGKMYQCQAIPSSREVSFVAYGPLVDIVSSSLADPTMRDSVIKGAKAGFAANDLNGQACPQMRQVLEAVLPGWSVTIRLDPYTVIMDCSK